MEKIFETIKEQITTHPIVLYMKGTKESPACGFSSVVAQILKRLSVDFHDVNVLEDFEIREGIKKYSDWPTIPQLYIKGEFLGGCDIVKELYQSGELKLLCEKEGLCIK